MSDRVEPESVWREWAIVGAPTGSDLSGVTFTRTIAPNEVERWPLPVLLHNWKLRVADRYRRWLVVSNGELHADGRQAISDLREWIDFTRALADRFPFGDAIPARMKELAVDVAGAIDWTGSRFVDPPGDLNGVVSFSLNADLWAADQVRQQLGQPRSTWLGTLFVAVDDDVPAARSEASIEQRIRRAAEAIIPGQEAALVADVLDALRSGPLHQGDSPPKPDETTIEVAEVRTSWASR